MSVTLATLGLLGGVIIGGAVVTGASIARSRTSPWVKRTGLAFCFGFALIGLRNVLDYDPGLGALHFVPYVITLSFFWPFSLLLFGYLGRPSRLILPGMALTLAYAASVVPVPWLQWLTSVVINIIIGGIGVGVVIAVSRSADDDLDPGRRKARRPFVLAVGFWIAFLAVHAMLDRLGLIPRSLVLVDDIGNAVMAIIGALVFTVPRPGLISPPPRGEQPETKKNDDDQALLEALSRKMSEDQVWREEGLTVRKLADLLQVPEHRLRPLINQHLGYRNFATFVNTHRLAEAKSRLRSPEHARENIATIAYACGFASLGPFGRAFKEDTGLTPTAYRKAHQNL